MLENKIQKECVCLPNEWLRNVLKRKMYPYFQKKTPLLISKFANDFLFVWINEEKMLQKPLISAKICKEVQNERFFNNKINNFNFDFEIFFCLSVRKMIVFIFHLISAPKFIQQLSTAYWNWTHEPFSSIDHVLYFHGASDIWQCRK